MHMSLYHTWPALLFPEARAQPKPQEKPAAGSTIAIALARGLRDRVRCVAAAGCRAGMRDAIALGHTAHHHLLRRRPAEKGNEHLFTLMS